MSDTDHNIEYHIVGFPESWKILAQAIDKYIREHDDDYTIEQVKEKYGSMRYYFSFSDNVDYDPEIVAKVAAFADLTYYMED